MDKVLEILESLHPDVSFAERQDLIDEGILDSFDIISLVNDLSDTFSVEIGMEHLEPENFNSVAAICALLKSLGAKM